MTTHSLTDRYVDVAMRGAPPKERPDLELELRGLIEDAIDAQLGGVDAASARDDAEAEALLELGDPRRLADRYRGRASFLIGPAHYHQWWDLLRVLLAVVVPIVVVVVGIVAATDGDDVIDVVGAAVWAGVSTAVQIAFWTTLVFALIERAQPEAGDDDGDSWTLDDLPELQDGQVSLGDTATTVVVAALTVAAMFWQRDSTLVTDGGAPVAILDPGNWTFWWPLLIVLLGVEVVLSILVLRRRHWTPSLFGQYAAVQVVFTAAVLWLVSQDRFFNPAFVAQLDWGDGADPGRILNAAIAVGVLAVTAWDLIDTGLALRRAQR